MEQVKLGIIGVGNMGSDHAKRIVNGDVPEIKLVAVADRAENRRSWAKENLPAEVQIFAEGDDLIDSKVCDAVLIAVPHYQHPILAMRAICYLPYN